MFIIFVEGRDWKYIKNPTLFKCYNPSDPKSSARTLSVNGGNALWAHSLKATMPAFTDSS